MEHEVWWKEGFQWKNKTVAKGYNSFTLEDVLPDHRLKVKVRSRTKMGFAPFSETVSFTTPPEPGKAGNFTDCTTQYRFRVGFLEKKHEA